MAHRNGSTPKLILEACQMSFNGKSVKDIAAELCVADRVVYGWRKTDVWQEFEMELITAYKRQLETESIAATADAN